MLNLFNFYRDGLTGAKTCCYATDFMYIYLLAEAADSRIFISDYHNCQPKEILRNTFVSDPVNLVTFMQKSEVYLETPPKKHLRWIFWEDGYNGLTPLTIFAKKWEGVSSVFNIFSCFWQHVCLMVSCIIYENLICSKKIFSSKTVVFLRWHQCLSPWNKLFCTLNYFWESNLAKTFLFFLK